MNDEKGSQWLYRRWLSIAEKHAGDLALVDFASGARWSFAELRRAIEVNECPREQIVYPSGQNAGFIFSVLTSWRADRIVCPLEAGQRPPEIREVHPRCAHLKLSSASTGPAKCILFTPQQLAADPATIVSTMGLRPEWPNLACISLSHSYGFSNFVLPLLLHGIPLVVLPAPLPEIVLRASRGFAGVTLASVPALWRTWHESNSIPANVQLAVSAGAPLAIELEQEIFRARGLKIHNFYGSSECGGIAYDRSNVPRTDSTLAGTAMSNVALSINSAGTLRVQSTAVGQTYWPTPQPDLDPPIFETSDLAELRKDEVFLRGRATDIINVAGRKVAPEIIESALRDHPAVFECLVFGLAEEGNERFETIVACVHLRDQADIGELARFLSGRLQNWQIPRQWWFTKELLVNQRGKLSRIEWRQRFLSTHPR